MKGSLVIIAFFVLGLVWAASGFLPEFLVENDLSMYALYLLMLLVGVGVGGDLKALEVIRQSPLRIAAVPLLVILGTLMGTWIASFFLSDISPREAMAVGAGFGYYSLSSVFINRISGEELGTIALIANISREIITLLFAPVLVFVFGKLAPIASGGATAMDTTLPIISRYSGKEYAIIAVFSGIILTIIVPFLVTFILTF